LVQGTTDTVTVLPGGTGSTWTIGTVFTPNPQPPAEACNYYSGILGSGGVLYTLFDNAPAGSPPRPR
jgi:hypothetical protein